DQANDAVAIDCARNRLPEPLVFKPLLFPGNLGQGFRIHAIQVKEQEIVFQARTEIVEMIVPGALLFLENREILGTESGQDVGITGLEANDLRVLTRDEQEYHLVKIRQAVAAAVLLPVVRIALEYDSLPGNVFLQPE